MSCAAGAYCTYRCGGRRFEYTRLHANRLFLVELRVINGPFEGGCRLFRVVVTPDWRATYIPMPTPRPRTCLARGLLFSRYRFFTAAARCRVVCACFAGAVGSHFSINFRKKHTKKVRVAAS